MGGSMIFVTHMFQSIDEKVKENLLKASLYQQLLAIKSRNGDGLKYILLKTPPFDLEFIPQFATLLPKDTVQAFMTRMPKASLKSMSRLIEASTPIPGYQKSRSQRIIKNCPRSSKNYSGPLQKLYDENSLLNEDFHYLLYAVGVKVALDYHNYLGYVFTYEDFIKDTAKGFAEVLRKVLRMTDEAEIAEAVKYGLEAMKQGAQNESITKNKKPKVFTDADWARLDKIYETIDLPFKNDVKLDDFKKCLKIE